MNHQSTAVLIADPLQELDQSRRGMLEKARCCLLFVPLALDLRVLWSHALVSTAHRSCNISSYSQQMQINLLQSRMAQELEELTQASVRMSCLPHMHNMHHALQWPRLSKIAL